MAVVLMMLFDAGFEAAIPFARSLAIVSYALIRLALNSLLVIALALFSPDPQQIDLLNPLVTSPAPLMTPAPGNFLYELLGRFELFRIWILCLLGLGFHLNAAPRKLSRTTAMVVVFGLYLGWALARAAVAAALS